MIFGFSLLSFLHPKKEKMTKKYKKELVKVFIIIFSVFDHKDRKNKETHLH